MYIAGYGYTENEWNSTFAPRIQTGLTERLWANVEGCVGLQDATWDPWFVW